jgi:hypothetical protein
MINYKKYFLLFEGVADTVNKHLTHLEELILTNKKEGAERAINYLTSMAQVLDSDTPKSVNTNIKYDGAPAVVVGKDPNGNFFVGSKSVFNATPKINYSIEDIKKNHSQAPGLVDKLVQTFVHLKDSNIDSVYQGDFLFDQEIKETNTIDGEEHVIFKPNTIVYAIPTDSEEGQKVLNAEVGIVFHTEYNVELDENNVPRFETKKFGVDVRNFKVSPKVYVKDADFESDAGYITLTNEESEKIADVINTSKEMIQQINFEDVPDNIFTSLNTYINTEIRQGEFLAKPDVSYQQYIEWFTSKLDKKIESYKTEKGKAKANEAKQALLSMLSSQKDNILKIFNLQIQIKQGKDIFIEKWNNIMREVQLKHYLFNDDGDLIPTNPEGYVAVDITGNAIKFVDRLEFSRANFSIDKSKKFK